MSTVSSTVSSMLSGARRYPLRSWKNVAQMNTKPSAHRLMYLQEQLFLAQNLENVFADLVALAMEDDPTPSRHRLVTNLQNSQDTCSRQIAITLQALSPIQWIPNEILSEIFSYCLPEDFHFSRTLAPLSLCRVCKAWRVLALSNHILWKNIAFWPPPTATKRDLLCYAIRLVNQWLSHSGALPLRLSFEYGMSRTHVKTFVELVLLEYYPHCQHLEFSVTPMTSLGLINFIKLPAGSLGRLESLVLDGLDEAVFSPECDEDEDEDDEDNNTPFPAMITAFRLSPRLRKLSTSSLDFTFRTGPNTMQLNINVLPWGPLTHLLITNLIGVNVFVYMLTECEAIQFLRVSLDLRHGDEAPHNNTSLPAHVVLPNLTNMYLSVHGGSSFPHEMDIFHFPALTVVHFRRFRDNPQMIDQFSWTESSLFCGQMGHLQHLTLTGHVGSTEEVIVFLQSTTTITQLSLDIFADYEKLLPSIFPPNMASSLPKLKNLELQLERRELCYPLSPIANIVEITRGSVTLRRMRNISLECLQPCVFRFREMIESTQLCLLQSLSLVYLQGGARDKALAELQKQFHLSTLTIQFDKKGTSSRVGTDQDLMEEARARTEEEASVGMDQDEEDWDRSTSISTLFFNQ